MAGNVSRYCICNYYIILYFLTLFNISVETLQYIYSHKKITYFIFCHSYLFIYFAQSVFEKGQRELFFFQKNSSPVMSLWAKNKSSGKQI